MAFQDKPVPPGIIKQCRREIIPFQSTDEFRSEPAGFSGSLGTAQFPDILQHRKVLLLDAVSGEPNKKSKTAIGCKKGGKGRGHVSKEGEIQGAAEKEKDHVRGKGPS